MNINQRKQGNDYEQAAADFLRKEGMFIKDINFYCKIGEIDIIATDGEYLVFVEVKYRKNTAVGHAAEAVDFRKMRKICRTADYYMMTHKLPSTTCVRFDVVAIENGHLQHIRNAFEYII